MPADPATRDDIRALTGAFRDVLDGLAEVNKALVIIDTKGDERAKRLDVLDGIRASIANIERPVVAHYDGIRLSSETEAANRGKWASILSPDKIATFFKFAVPMIAALAAGGGLGANFRGCGAILTTANDAPVIVTPELP